jgi:hypothetical protein
MNHWHPETSTDYKSTVNNHWDPSEDNVKYDAMPWGREDQIAYSARIEITIEDKFLRSEKYRNYSSCNMYMCHCSHYINLNIGSHYRFMKWAHYNDKEDGVYINH